jgi:hypothetical protein
MSGGVRDFKPFVGLCKCLLPSRYFPSWSLPETMAGSWLKRLHPLMSAFVERKLKSNPVIARKS